MFNHEGGEVRKNEPKIPLELREINDSEMRIWFDSFKIDPEDFPDWLQSIGDSYDFRKFIQELTQRTEDPRIVAKWVWLLHNTSPVETHACRHMRRFDKNTEPGAIANDGSIPISSRFGCSDSEAHSLFYGVLGDFCANNPHLIPLLLTEHHKQYLPNATLDMPLHAPSGPSGGSRIIEHGHYSEDDSYDLTSWPQERGDLMRQDFIRSRYKDTAASFEAIAEQAVDSFSKEQARKYCDTALSALLAGENYMFLHKQIPLLEKAAGGYAVKKLMLELKKLSTSGDKKKNHVNERNRYILLYLLRFIKKEPALVSVDKRTCNFLDTDITFESFLPKEATSVGLLSVYGEVGVFDDENKLLGYFSFFDALQNKGRAEFKALSEVDPLVDFSEEDISKADRRAILDSWGRSFPMKRNLLSVLPLREQAVFTYALMKDRNAALTLAKLSFKNPLLLRCYLMAAAFSGFSFEDVTSAIESSNHFLFAQHGHKMVHHAEQRLVQAYQERSDDPTLLQAVGYNIHDRLRFLYPDAVDTFLRSIDSAKDKAAALKEELKAAHPGLDLSEQALIRGFLYRETQALASYEGGRAQRGTYFLSRQRENNAYHWALAAFEEMANLVDSGKIVDLKKYYQQQQALAKLIRDPDLKVLVVDTLRHMKSLLPVPEAFWRVDRPITEYNERSGLNFIGFLQDLTPPAEKPDDKEVAVEFGGGSGVALAQHLDNSKLKSRYHEFNLAREVHYPIRPLVVKLIDTEKLGLTGEDADKFIDYIYKALYIESGMGADDNIDDHYDQESITAITQDPNNLKELLKDLGSKLLASVAMPSEVGIQPLPDGKKLYLEKVHPQEQGAVFSNALKAFSKAPESYLRSNVLQADLKRMLPIHPAGLVLGKFNDSIKRFQTESIKAAFGIRSVVYEKYYEEFMVEMADKLKMGGAYVGDCVRENFGKRYKLPELINIGKKITPPCTIYVISGPGVPGDDFNQTDAIRSIVITKGEVNTDIITNNLQTGYRARSLDQVMEDASYLESLYEDAANNSNYQELIKTLAVA